MSKLMDYLYEKFKPLVEARWFGVMLAILVLLNPISIFPQVITALTAPSVEGISLPMWYMFAGIQSSFVFQGIKSKNASMFVSMLLTLCCTLSIIIIVHVRR